jgi:signal transduction histidine kinase/DNA-binding response OmpR family regulator
MRLETIYYNLFNLICFVVLSVIVIALLVILFLRRANEKKKLEKLVELQTGDLTARLQKATAEIELLKSAGKAKSNFYINISNEVLTILNSIVGYLVTALDVNASQKTNDSLSNIRINAEKVMQIINDIMDISKIESGELSLKKNPFDMHELFAGCRTLVMPKAVEKGLLLHFYAEPSVGKRPVGDIARLRQIFVNLLSNAVKYTNTGMVKLVSDILSIDEKSITIHFEVKDSGVGMTQEQIAHIFQPFSQVEKSYKNGSTGLSLPITKKIVEMMGGALSVDSTPGIGSRFSFDLTFDTIDVSMDEMLKERASYKEIEKPLFEGEILICEDNFMKQEVIREHLVNVGLKTEIAENGLIGIELVKNRLNKGEKLYDLILMDMHMPVMDGLEAAVEIVKMGVKIPIIALTANIMVDDLDMYKTHGIVDCVSKPFTSQELWRCLLKHMAPTNKSESYNDIRGEKMPESKTGVKESFEKHFFQTNIDKYDEICKYMEKGDIRQAYKLVCALKENAAQVGKTRLQSAATVVEHQLADDRNSVTPEQMLTLKTELDAVLAEFKSLIDKNN